MRTFLVVLSSMLSVGSIVPYFIAVVRGNARPRIVSWAIWTLLGAIASTASFSDHQIPSAVLLLFCTVQTGLICVIGFKNGDRVLERIDILCLLGALLGLVLWYVFNSPAVAVMATITIDLVGCIPTIKHSWEKPHEESWLTFSLAGLCAFVTVCAASSWKITAVAYPLYLIVGNGLIVTVILASPHRKVAGEPPELREL